MSAEEIASFVAGPPGGDKALDSEQLARQLVREKKLTAYQAKKIYAGRGKSLVLGNYVVLDKLGQGGMGLVLKAEHRRMERVVALKVLSPKVVRTPDALRRFQREVKAADRLMHPNIVTAHDADEAGGTHFLVMEYVDGSDLSTLVKRRGPLPLDEALNCVLQTARGLQYAHEHGVIHRDIKPANLLLDGEGTVKILDMGLARLESAGDQQDELTGTGQVMGTVDYMAPEQAMDTKHADARADIYSLGVTLWYLLTGRPLYAGQTTVEKLMAHQTKPIPSLQAVCPEVTPALDTVFHRMVTKKPLDRQQTMTEVIGELEPLCGGRAPSAPAGTWAAPAPAPKVDVTQDWSGSNVEAETRGMALQNRAGAPEVPASRSMALQSRAESSRAAAQGAAKHGAPGTARRAMLRGAGWRDWRWLTAVGAGGVLVIWLGIWVVVRDKEGNEVARVRLPEGGSVTHEADVPAPSPAAQATDPKPLPPWNLPPSSPPPAIAPFDAAQAKEHQAAWAKHLGVELETENSTGMRFVLIPPGEFDMGSTEAEVAKLLEEAKAENLVDSYIKRLPSEAPKHRVRITAPVSIAPRCQAAP